MTLLKPIIFKFIGFNITCLLAYTPSFQVSTFNFTSLYLFFEFGLLTTVVYLVIDRMTVNSFYKTKSFVLMYVYAILLIQLSFYCFHLLGFELDNTIFAAVASTGSNLVWFDNVDLGIFSSGLLQVKLSFLLTVFIFIFFSIWVVILFWNYEVGFLHLTSEYLILLLVNLLFCSLLLKVKSLFMIWFILECISISTYLLLASDKTMPSYHTYLYFIFNALAGVLILFGFNVLNIFELQDIYSGLLDSTFIDIDAQQLYSFNFGLILLFLGFFIKLGLAPFHFWAVDVYETLNTEVFFVLVVLNKASIVFALFSIMKVISVNNLLLKSAGFILTSIILISIFIGALGAFNETNFQRFMTFASLPQIGYVLLGLISNQTSVFVSALAYFCIYILTLLLMYLLMRVVTFKVIYLTDFHALLFYNRPIGLAFISILFSLAGLPPFIGFLAKFILFQALVLANYYSLVILLLLVSIISIIYYLRVIIILATVQPAKQFTSSQIKKELIPNQSTGVVFYALIQMVVILSLVGVNFSYFWFVDFLAQAF